LVAGFILLIKMLRVVENSSKGIRIATASLSIIRNNQLDDLEKEKQLQENSVQLFKIFVLILIGVAASLGAPIGLIFLIEILGFVTFKSVLTLTISWEFLLFTSLFGGAVVWFWKRK